MSTIEVPAHRPSTKITWDHGLLTVERISVGTQTRVSLQGQVKIRTKNGQIEQARSTFRASGFPVERVLSPFQAKPVHGVAHHVRENPGGI